MNAAQEVLDQYMAQFAGVDLCLRYSQLRVPCPPIYTLYHMAQAHAKWESTSTIHDTRIPRCDVFRHDFTDGSTLIGDKALP